jgi:hypothetical protein
MVPPLFDSHRALWAMLGRFVLWPRRGPRRSAPPPPGPAPPLPPRRPPSPEPPAVAGLTPPPPGAPGARATGAPPPGLPPRPAPLPLPPRRPRPVAPSRHGCPPPACASRGWLARHHVRAQGPPQGGPWRPWHGTACGGYVPEHHGTIPWRWRTAACLRAPSGGRLAVDRWG